MLYVKKMLNLLYVIIKSFLWYNKSTLTIKRKDKYDGR